MASSSSVLKHEISGKKECRVTSIRLDSFDCFEWDMPLCAKRNLDEKGAYWLDGYPALQLSSESTAVCLMYMKFRQ